MLYKTTLFNTLCHYRIELWDKNSNKKKILPQSIFSINHFVVKLNYSFFFYSLQKNKKFNSIKFTIQGGIW
jgi:hypothetical protein